MDVSAADECVGTDPLQDLVGTTDVVHAVLTLLDVPTMCRLALVSSQWNRLVLSDENAWRERAREIGVTELPEGGTWRSAVRDGWAVLIGDAFEVIDTYGITAVARVMAKVDLSGEAHPAALTSAAWHWLVRPVHAADLSGEAALRPGEDHLGHVVLAAHEGPAARRVAVSLHAGAAAERAGLLRAHHFAAALGRVSEGPAPFPHLCRARRQPSRLHARVVRGNDAAGGTGTLVCAAARVGARRAARRRELERGG